MLKGLLKTYLPKTWRSRMGVLLGIAAISLYTLPCMAEGVSAPQESAASNMEGMQKELRALKAQVESLRAELGATKQEQEVKADEELFASKQEFSQLSQEVEGLKAPKHEEITMEAIQAEIKKGLGGLIWSAVTPSMEYRTRAEYSNMFHNVLAHQTDANPRVIPGVLSGLPIVSNPVGPINKGAVGRVSEDQTIVLARVRLGLGATLHEHLRTFLQIQNARFWGSGGGVLSRGGGGLGDLGFGVPVPVGVPNVTSGSQFDLHQAYVDITDLFHTDFTVRVGRQEIIWGNHRMMGNFDFSNLGFTWDAIRVLRETDRYAFQAFGAIQNHVGFQDPDLDLVDNDLDDEDHQTYGAMFTFKKLIPNASLELMYLMDNDQRATVDTGLGIVSGTALVPTQGQEVNVTAAGAGEMEVHDFGFRLPGKIGKAIDYEVESHYQLGDFRGRAHEALAAMAKIGYTFDEAMWKPRIGYEFDWSPGDGRPGKTTKLSGDKHRTFHQFYPTNHTHFGYIDLVAWKNIRAHRFQFNANPTKKLKSQVDFWYFDLDKNDDAWYNASQVLFRRAPFASEVGRHLGKEVDFTLWYELYPAVGIQAGYSRFISGSFIDATSREKALAGDGALRTGIGSRDGDTDWGYLQLTVGF